MKIKYKTTVLRSRLSHTSSMVDTFLFAKETLFCTTFQLAFAWSTALSGQSKWSITNWLMAQQLLYPSQIHADNLEKKGNYDLCLLWVSLNNNFAHCQ